MTAETISSDEQRVSYARKTVNAYRAHRAHQTSRSVSLRSVR